MAFGKPKTPLTPEQQLQKRQNVGVGLAALSETLRGGDPVGRTLGLQQQLEQKDLDKQLDDAIDNSNLPQSQKDLLKSLNTQTKAQTLMQAYEPTKELKAGEQIRIEELNVLRKLEALDGDVKKLNNYEKLIYKNFIEKEDSQSILQQLGLIPSNTSSQPLEIEEIKKG